MLQIQVYERNVTCFSYNVFLSPYKNKEVHIFQVKFFKFFIYLQSPIS